MDADARLLPQKPVIAAPIPLPPATPSSLLAPPRAGPSFKPVSKPASTAPVDIDPQSQAHADTLTELGIKVRDFAYESKLPPIQPYRVRQIQPGPRPLKRNRPDGVEDDVLQNQSGAAEGSSSKRSKLEREVTEPDMTQLQPFPARARGFINFNDAIPKTPPLYQSQPTEFSQPSGSSQPIPTILESQDSEPYVVTPLVSPNGSLHWPDVTTMNDIPASQLDTESQANNPVLLTYSQLGMPEPELEADTTGTGLIGNLTPMSSLSSVGSDAPAPLLPRASNLGLSSRNSPHTLSSSSHSSQKPVTPPLSAPRYQLRRRPIPLSPQSPTKKQKLTHKGRKMYKPAHSLSRPMAFSAQASHTKAKVLSSSSSPRGRIVRNRAGPSKLEETMIVR